MPIVNINTVQNNISYSDYMTSYTDVYVKQSLANLGQRLGVKGDGISSSSFPISDVFNDYLDDITDSNVVKLSYNYTDSTINMYLCSYTDGDSDVTILKNVGTNVAIDYIDNAVSVSEDFGLSNTGAQINNVDHYKSGSIILKGQDYYITSAIGLSSSSSSDDVIQEYVCDKIKTDGTLIEGLRIVDADKYLDNPTGTQSLVMLHVWMNEDVKSTRSGYVVDVYTPTNGNMNGYNTLENYCSIIEELYDSQKTFISPAYIKNVLAPSSGNSNNYFSWSLTRRFQQFYEILDSTVYTIANGLTYNNSDNQYWKLSDAYAKIVLDNEQTFNLNDVVNYFASDCTSWFETVKEKYNDLLYVSEDDETEDSNLKLKKQLFGALIKKLFADWIKQESTVTENINVYNVYVPADFRIYYNCNDNDTSIIYNSTRDIVVKFQANPIDKIDEIIGSEHSDVVIATSSENKVAKYGFTITYIDDDTQTGIIDEIEFLCLSVLPYVNDNGYWCIDDEQTDIYAIGENAGNPNIILAYSDAVSFQVVQGISKDVLETWDWEQQRVRIEPLDRDNNLGDGFYYDLMAYMPATEFINNLDPSDFSLINNALFVNFLSPETEVYPERYSTTYYVNKDKIIYSDFTYDSTTAQYVNFATHKYNEEVASKSFQYSGTEALPLAFQSMVNPAIWTVTSESGDAEASRLTPSVTYRNSYDMEHEAWQYSYHFVMTYGLYQSNWLNNRSWTDSKGTYEGVKDDGTTYTGFYYDKVMYDIQLSYSYWWPLQYTADYSNAYEAHTEINEESLEYKLGANGVITTFWGLEKNEDTNSYEWTYIKKPNSIFALDTNYINNLDNNIKYYLNNAFEPDNYTHRWVVFEKTNRLLKNNTIDNASYIYPVVKNKSRDEFVSMFGEMEDENIEATSYEIYNNDLNFEVAFYDTVQRNNTGDIIDGGVKQSDERYWKGTAYDFHRLDPISDNDPTSSTYGEIILKNNSFSYTGVDGVIKYSLYPNEYVPNSQYDANDTTYAYQYPTLELKEVLVRDASIENRVNIMTFDNQPGTDGHMIYHAYFGTSYETPNKNTLIVGTSYRNINLGTDTMTTYESTYNLAPHNILQLNVDNIELNGYSNINKDVIANKAIWKSVSTTIEPTGEELRIYSTIVQPTGIAYWMGPELADMTVVQEDTTFLNDSGRATIITTLNDQYSVLSYNQSLLSYLNRARHTQSRYFNHEYEGDGTNNSLDVNISYGQTLSYLNVTKMLSDYCSIETDCNTYIYGDSHLLYNIDTLKLRDGNNEAINKTSYDTTADVYAIMRAKNSYFLQLSTDLSDDENLLMSYTYQVNNSYVTQKYMTTNPIAITYANYSYAKELEYGVDKYVYAFTYASSYYMEYQCPGCSLCSSDTCKYIQHCKWSEIVGYFNVATCWVPIDQKKSAYTWYEMKGSTQLTHHDGDGKTYIESLYDSLVSEGTNKWKYKDSYRLSYEALWNPKTGKNTTYTTSYDVSRISYTCWSDNVDDPRFLSFNNPSTFATRYNAGTQTYFPEQHFWIDTTSKKDAQGNYKRLGYIYAGVEPTSYHNSDGIAYFTYHGSFLDNAKTVKQYDLYESNKFTIDGKTIDGTSYFISNSYYSHIPVSYYDALRNLIDTYRKIVDSEVPVEFDNAFGSYLWINAPESALYKNSSGEFEELYYSTDERDFNLCGTYAETPSLLVAQYVPTFQPVNNNTTDIRGWDIAYYTDANGDNLHGTYYNYEFDMNGDGYVDENDLSTYKKFNYSNPSKYTDEGLAYIENLIALNTDQTTYTCYFTYLGDFVNTTFVYFSYKAINIRELTTSHSLPYMENSDLLTTNMQHYSVVDSSTIGWNFDTTDTSYIVTTGAHPTNTTTISENAFVYSDHQTFTTTK